MMNLNFLPSPLPAVPATPMARPAEGQAQASQEDGASLEFQLALVLALDGQLPVKESPPPQKVPAAPNEGLGTEAAEAGGLSEAAGAVIAEYVSESMVLPVADDGGERQRMAPGSWNSPWSPSMPIRVAGPEVETDVKPSLGVPTGEGKQVAKPVTTGGVSLPVIYSALAKASPPILDLNQEAGRMEAARMEGPRLAETKAAAVTSGTGDSRNAMPQGIASLIWEPVEIVAVPSENAEITQAGPLPATENFGKGSGSPVSAVEPASIPSPAMAPPRAFVPRLIEMAVARITTVLHVSEANSSGEPPVSPSQALLVGEGEVSSQAATQGQARLARILAAYGGQDGVVRQASVSASAGPLVDWALVEDPMHQKPAATRKALDTARLPEAPSAAQETMPARGEAESVAPAVRAFRSLQVQSFLASAGATMAGNSSEADPPVEGSAPSPRPSSNSAEPLLQAPGRGPSAKAALAAAAEASLPEAARGDRGAAAVQPESVNPLPPPVAAASKPDVTVAPALRSVPIQASSPEIPAQQAQPSGQVTVQFRGEDGTEGQLRVLIRGGTLRATIQTADAETAQRLNHEIGEIQRALTGKGFTEAQVLIQQARAAEEPGASQRQAGSQDQASTDREKERRPQGQHGRDPEPARDDRSKDPRRRKEDR